jgi:hypothetical protein
MQLQALYVYGVFNVTNAIGKLCHNLCQIIKFCISKSLRGS